MAEPDEERLQNLVKNAFDDSVTANRLTRVGGGLKTTWLRDHPLWSYLNYGEQPHFILYANRLTPDFYGPAAPDALNRSRLYKVVHMVTDSRWIMVAGTRQGNDTRKFPLDEIGAVNFAREDGVRKHVSNREFVFEYESETLCVVAPISNDFEYDVLDDLSQFVANKADADHSDAPINPSEEYDVGPDDSMKVNREMIANLLDQVPTEAEEKADDLVAETDDATELVMALESLVEEYSNEQSIDKLVADAESAEALRRDVESSLEELQRKAREGMTDVGNKISDSDPQEVSEWSMGVGQASLPLAFAAPSSTVRMLLGFLVAGGIAGVYQSGGNDTVLDDLDPQELAQHAQAMSKEGKDIEQFNGEAVGALLGAFQYIGQTMPDEEYAKWFTQADVEALMQGAEAGAIFAAQNDVEGTKYGGVLAGASLGLAHSYIQDIDGFRETVDEDIYKEYLEKLTKQDIPIEE